MTGLNNVGIYQNFWDCIQKIKTPSKRNNAIRFFLNPLDNTIHYTSSTLTNYALLPSTKLAYRSLGFIAIQSTALLSSRVSKWVEGAWYDPISTRTLLKIGKWVEAQSKPISKQKSTELPVLEACDKVRIALARHFYVVSKDFNSIFSIPGALRNYVNWTTIEPPSSDKETKPKSLTRRGWILFKRGTKAIRNALLSIISKVISTITFPFQKVPYLDTARDWIVEKIDAARNHIHQSVTKRAHFVIDHAEAKVRQTIIQKIGEIAARSIVNQTLNLGIKFAISSKVYLYTKDTATQMLGYQEVSNNIEWIALSALKIASFTVFMHTIIPAIERLQDDYEKEFQTEASTLKELASLVNRQNLPKIISFIYKKIL